MESLERPKKVKFWLAPVLGVVLFCLIFPLCWCGFWFAASIPQIFSNRLFFLCSGTREVIHVLPGPLFVAAAFVIPMTVATTITAIAARRYRGLVLIGADGRDQRKKIASE